jgi:AcrR family transcriptional regulator
MSQVTLENSKDAPRVDRRILRTRLALRTALVELIQEKGYEALSVEEITQRANLGRATFYLHYKDVEDLLLEEFTERASDQVRLITEIPLSFWKKVGERAPSNYEIEPILPLHLVFKHAAENAEFYRVILRGQNSQRIANRINEIIVASYNEVINTKFPNMPTKIFADMPVDLLAVFFSGALLSCINWWLEHNLTPPPEKMALIFQNLYLPGVFSVLGTNKPAPHPEDQALSLTK